MKKTYIAALSLSLAACSQAQADISEAELAARPDISTIDFGSDGGDYTNDGECDDPRFSGPGMTGTELLEEDEMNDASDCKAAYEQGTLIMAEDRVGS